MKRYPNHKLAYSLLFLFCLAPGRAAAQSGQGPVLVIEGGTLIDANGGAPVRDALVIIRGNKIETVSRKGQATYPADSQVLRADGKFIIPGLMDAHVHYDGFLAELMLSYGITSAIDHGGRGLYQVARREAIARGRMPGPRLFISVETIYAPVVPGRIVYSFEGRQGPLSTEKVRQIIKGAADAGADVVNIHRGLSEEAFRAGVAEAHKANLSVIAQPIGPTVYAREAALAGVDVLEHASGVSYSIAKDPSKWKGWGESELHSLDVRPYSDMDDAKAADLIKLLVAKHVALEVNLIAEGRSLHKQRTEWESQDYNLLANPALAYIPEGVRYKWLANFREFDDWSPADREMLHKGFKNYERFVGMFVKAGGKVLTGTDTSFVGWGTAGTGLHHEMELLVESGLTPMEAIQAATRNVAEALRWLNRLGTIEAGKLADVVVVNEDPLRDIRNLEKIEWVIKDGKVVDRTYHASFSDSFSGDHLEAPEWVEALKRVNEEGIRILSGLTDRTSAFGQPCPGIESLSPFVVTEGSPTATVKVNGVNFTNKSLAYFGAAPLPTRLVSDSELEVTINAGLIQRAAIVPIMVRNPGPFLSQPKFGNTSNRAFLLINFK